MSEEEAKVEETEKKVPAKKPTSKKKESTESNIIYIGKKNTMNYVLVAITILNKSNQCQIQARGRQISKAVDVAEITKRKFPEDNVEVASVLIGSEEIESHEEGIPPKTVSTVEITLNKAK